jgi:hypothetical protein
MTLLGSTADPGYALTVVLRNAFALDVHDPEVSLRVGIALLGGAAEPGHSLAVVLWDAFALGVPDPEVELRLGNILLGGAAVPDRGLAVVLRDTFAFRCDATLERPEHTPTLERRSEKKLAHLALIGGHQASQCFRCHPADRVRRQIAYEDDILQAWCCR